MKTNIVNLMQIVSEEERKFSSYGYNLKSYAYNIVIEELDGKKNTTEDYNDDFKQVYSELNNSKEKLIKMKSIPKIGLLSEPKNHKKISKNIKLKRPSLKLEK